MPLFSTLTLAFIWKDGSSKIFAFISACSTKSLPSRVALSEAGRMLERAMMSNKTSGRWRLIGRAILNYDGLRPEHHFSECNNGSVFASKNEPDPGRECQSFKQMWRSKRENSCATLLTRKRRGWGRGKAAIVHPISPYVESNLPIPRSDVCSKLLKKWILLS